MTSTPTVFVVDDDPKILKALARLLSSLGLNAVTFDSAAQFLASYDTETPGCLLLDIDMPGLSGIELQRTLADRGSLLPIVFLTGHGDIPTSVQAMKRGAVDFLTKPVDEQALVSAIANAFKKDRALREERSELDEFERRMATLTPREREVFGHIVTGRLNKQIAAELGTVEKTIKVHRARVMEKMQAHSLAELVRLAERARFPPAPLQDRTA